MVQISKKDTLDIADRVAIKIILDNELRIHPGLRRHFTDMIQVGLNDWISECETEDAEYKKMQIDNTPGTGEMMDGDY